MSEENSAADQEVSAATEEMSAQAEEVVASAATRAEMAQQLDVLMARFRVAEGRRTAAARASDNVLPRRRPTDWTRCCLGEAGPDHSVVPWVAVLDAGSSPGFVGHPHRQPLCGSTARDLRHVRRSEIRLLQDAARRRET